MHTMKVILYLTVEIKNGTQTFVFLFLLSIKNVILNISFVIYLSKPKTVSYCIFDNLKITVVNRNVQVLVPCGWLTLILINLLKIVTLGSHRWTRAPSVVKVTDCELMCENVQIVRHEVAPTEREFPFLKSLLMFGIQTHT